MLARVAVTTPWVVWAYLIGAGVAALSLLTGYIIGRYNRRQRIDHIARLYAGEELDRLRALCAAQEAELQPYRSMVRVVGLTIDEIVSARMRRTG